jgi:hypothetical protein
MANEYIAAIQQESCTKIIGRNVEELELAGGKNIDVYIKGN